MSPAGNTNTVPIAAPAAASDAEKIAGLIPDVIEISDLERVYRKLVWTVSADRKRAGLPENCDAWEVVTLEGVDLKSLKLAACRAAETGDFLGRLAEGLAHAANALATEPEPTGTQVKDLLQAAVGGYGFMQAISAEDRGFLQPALIDKLPSIMRATAYVSSGQEIIGTAFLVGPDTVLTAAHVVLDDDGKQKPDLSFTFSDPASTTPASRRFSPRPKHPPIFSLPYGKFPNAKRALAADSDQHLDYAFIRLTGRVNGIKPIDIAAKPQQNSGAHVFIFGYRGGTAINADVFTGITAKNPGKRFIHTLNAVAGMSGAPCIGPTGEVIGLHEAGFKVKDQGQEFVENRAVDANHIYQDIVSGTKKSKPLAPLNSATDYGLYDAALRQAWAKRGQELAGPAQADAWKRAVLSIGDPAPSSGDAVRAFHPLLNSGAQLAVAWVRELTEKSTFRRVASVTSPHRGGGASFSIDRLAAALDDAKQLFRYDIVKGGSKAPHEILGIVPEDDPARPAAGWTKYDLVAAAMAQIDKTSVKDRPVFVAIDFGGAAVVDDALDTWTALIHAIIARDGLHLLLVAPPPGQDLTAGAKLPDGAAFDPMADLQPIIVDAPNEGHVVNCLRALSGALGQPFAAGPEIVAAKDRWAAATGLAVVPPELATVHAVWLVLSVMAARGMVEG